MFIFQNINNTFNSCQIDYISLLVLVDKIKVNYNLNDLNINKNNR